MAIDTALKRQSAAGVGQPFLFIPPFPDGDLSGQADRQHFGLSYSGILAGLPVQPNVAPSVRTALVSPELRIAALEQELRLATVGPESRIAVV